MWLPSKGAEHWVVLATTPQGRVEMEHILQLVPGQAVEGVGLGQAAEGVGPGPGSGSGPTEIRLMGGGLWADCIGRMAGIPGYGPPAPGLYEAHALTVRAAHTNTHTVALMHGNWGVRGAHA